MIVILTQHTYLKDYVKNSIKKYNKINYLLSNISDQMIMDAEWSCYARYSNSHFYI
jgi:hypothetical protein